MGESRGSRKTRNALTLVIGDCRGLWGQQDFWRGGVYRARVAALRGTLRLRSGQACEEAPVLTPDVVPRGLPHVAAFSIGADHGSVGFAAPCGLKLRQIGERADDAVFCDGMGVALHHQALGFGTGFVAA